MAKVENNSEQCSICMEAISDENKFITECKHTFHKDCFEHYDYINRKTILRCPLCNKVLRIPVIDDEIIEKEIHDYINDWGNLDCDGMIEQIKLTYKDKFIIDDDYIKQKCEEVKRQMGGKKRTRRNHKKRTKKGTKKRNKRNHKKRHFK